MGNSKSGSVDQLQQLETDLLNWGLDWYNTSDVVDGKRNRLSWRAYDVSISVPNVSGKGESEAPGHIHTVEFTNEENNAEDSIPIVLMHGYGAGSGHYFSTLPAVADMWKGKVYSIDSYGCGLSSRPKWALGVGEKVSTEEAESVFVEALEAWRAAQEIEEMVLFGHSLGGYLSVAYAEKYPERVHHLMLCSPVGIPEKPEGMNSSSDSFGRKVGKLLWTNGVSPFHMVKATGRRFIRKYVDHRFEDASWLNKTLLQEYMYLNWTTGNISAGGYAHATLLEPGAYARKPLHSRLHDVAETVDRISFIYGSHDWMNVNHAVNVRSSLFSKYPKNITSTFPAIDIYEVEGGGHNMFIDNPLGVAAAVRAIMAEDSGRTGLSNVVSKVGLEYIQRESLLRGQRTAIMS